MDVVILDIEIFEHFSLFLEKAIIKGFTKVKVKEICSYLYFYIFNVFSFINRRKIETFHNTVFVVLKLQMISYIRMTTSMSNKAL